MRVMKGGSALAFRMAVVAAAMTSSAAWGGEVRLKDKSIESPIRDSVLVIGFDGNMKLGISVNALQEQLDLVSKQERALKDLQDKNQELSKKVEEQARKIRDLERKQESEQEKLSRSVSSQKSDLDKLSRELEDLRRRVK